MLAKALRKYNSGPLHDAVDKYSANPHLILCDLVSYIQKHLASTYVRWEGGWGGQQVKHRCTESFSLFI